MSRNQEPIALNAIETIALYGFADTNEPIEFHRGVPSRGNSGVFRLSVVDPLCTEGEPPAPEESTLYAEHPGHEHLELKLGSLLECGRTGYVHAVSCEGPGALDVPELVAKISFPHLRPRLSREAWIYEDLRSLQGAVIPRCYGYFEAQIPEGMVFMQECHRARRVPNLSGDFEVIVPNIVGILLLERLSNERLPLNVRFGKDWCNEIHDLYKEISESFVDVRDIAHGNIIRVSRSPHALPSLPGRTTGRVFEWRVIDLEDCVKHTVPRDYHMINFHTQHVDTLLGCLQRGITNFC
ncbi:unnamed protein product [Peniophora sp. CBMAI 1063]|nr:unnamed protein product [Peniophora sp. CBMAI 1063]